MYLPIWCSEVSSFHPQLVEANCYSFSSVTILNWIQKGKLFLKPHAHPLLAPHPQQKKLFEWPSKKHEQPAEREVAQGGSISCVIESFGHLKNLRSNIFKRRFSLIYWMNSHGWCGYNLLNARQRLVSEQQAFLKVSAYFWRQMEEITTGTPDCSTNIKDSSEKVFLV